MARKGVEFCTSNDFKFDNVIQCAKVKSHHSVTSKTSKSILNMDSNALE